MKHQISILREFMIPLTSGMGVIKVPYPMSEDDFELFTDTLDLWKKRLVQTTPRKAIWKNAHNDKPVTIFGEMGERDGVKYYKSEDGTDIPATELKFTT